MAAMRTAFLVLCSLTVAGIAAGQSQHPKTGGDRNETSVQPLRPVVRHATFVGVSPPLRDIQPGITGATARGPSKPHAIFLGRLKMTTAAKTAVHSVDSLVQTAAPSLAMPGLALNFEGLDSGDNPFVGILPPDPNGDVGPSNYVQQVNIRYQVFDKATGTALTAPLAMSDLFTNCGCTCGAGDQGDPIVLYDPLADRWLLSELAFDTDPLLGNPIPPFFQSIAISQTSDPAGSYYVYCFQMPDSKLNDYSKFGVWSDAYYMSDNQFLGDLATFAGAGVFAFDRAKMLVGDPTASFIYFNPAPSDPNFGGLLPADLDGPPPPVGTPNYFAYYTATANGDPQDAVRVFAFHADFGNPANSTFTEAAGSPLAVTAFTPNAPNIPQPGGAPALDSLSDRFMYRLQYRNSGDHESLVVNHTVNAGAGRAGVRYYQLRRPLPGGTFFVYDQSTFAPADGLSRWMGSAALDHQGNFAVGYSASSSTQFPSIRYAGRLASDPTNSLSQGEATLINGGGSQTWTDPAGGASRWGDYSMMAVDPVDDCSFWYTQEYYGSTSESSWQTRIGKFKFAGCSAAAIGTLQGTVTDNTTGLPVASALVTTADGFVRVTGSDGTYSMAVPPGVYAMSASAPGYSPVSVSGVNVSDGSTTIRHFNLAPSPAPAVHSSAIDDSGANNNGQIDPNECVRLNIVVTNRGMAAATVVTGTLSTTNAGVIVAQATSTYPDMTAHTSAPNDTPFKISTSPTMPCGSTIQMTLLITYAGGATTNTFTLTAGTQDYIITQASGASIVPGNLDVIHNCDNCTATINLPFPYMLYGQSYSRVAVSSNGNLQFGNVSSIDLFNQCLPAADFGPTIFAHWEALFTGDIGEGIFTSTSGSAPNRVFNIEWRADYLFLFTTINFEVRLYEGQPRFDIIYGSVSDEGNNATVGVQNGDGTAFTEFACVSGGLISGLRLTFHGATCPDGGGQCVETLPTITMAANDAAASEPGGNTGKFTVTLTVPTNYPLIVNYTVGGTAAPGIDYSNLTGSVTISVGKTNATVTVYPIDDAILECPETVIATLSASANYLISSPSNATVTITDNELPTVTIVASDPNASELGPNTGTFTLTRTGCTNAALAVTLSFGGTATMTNDYTAISKTKTIPAGQTTVTIIVTPVADAAVEGSETVIATIAASTKYVIGSPSNATVTIANNVPATVTITATDPNASEPGSNTGTFTVTRTGDTTTALVVSLSFSGTATMSTATVTNDYKVISTSKNIPAGTNSATIIARPVNDTLVEVPETVIATIVSSSKYIVGSPGSATVTITDDDVAAAAKTATTSATISTTVESLTAAP
ncbi:MAG: hypothetical protein EXS18_06225 [Verrucomicrobiae bacterium]|nr:hypothetical protein [Verrucomicrobiae bacterium]